MRALVVLSLFGVILLIEAHPYRARGWLPVRRKENPVLDCQHVVEIWTVTGKMDHLYSRKAFV